MIRTLWFVTLLSGLALFPAPGSAALLSFHVSGLFGNTYGGPLNGGSFSGSYSIAALPLLPPDTGSSYVYLPSYDIVMKNGSTLVEFKPGLNGSTGIFSAVYETANGGDFLQFYDSANDNLTLYFAKGFTGIGPVVRSTSKGYISDAGVGGYAGGNISNVASGVSSAPEPSSALLALAAAGLIALRRFIIKLRPGDARIGYPITCAMEGRKRASARPADADCLRKTAGAGRAADCV